MAEVKFVGFDDIEVDVAQQKQIDDLVKKHAEIIDRLLNNEVEIKIHVKRYSQSGNLHKYSIHIHVHYPGGTFVSDKAHDWHLHKSLKQAFKALEHQIEHKFHS